MIDGVHRAWSEVGDGVAAFTQLPGTWGWSNSGLVIGDGASLLVDTLFDAALTKSMLAGAAGLVEGRPIRTLVNTHANGDHCYGNSVLDDDVDVVATVATAEGMTETTPEVMAALLGAGLDDPLGSYLDHAFGAFDFAATTLRTAGDTFEGRLLLDVGGRPVELVELGPAHTSSDTVVHVPDAGVVFTGDLVFNEGTPICWAGPVSGWVAACDAIAALSPGVIVAGHGPLTTVAVLDDTSAYLKFVESEATPRLRAGMDPLTAALDIPLGEFAFWSDAERIVANVATIARHLGIGEPWGVLDVMGGMATWWDARGR